MPENMPFVAVQIHEGEEFMTHEEFLRREYGKPKEVHAILFANGRIWDAVNGWRQREYDVATYFPKSDEADGY